MHTIRTVLRNYSRHAPETVWENAQDLEHVAFLHGDTNKGFRLLYAAAAPGSRHVYDVLVYSSRRSLYGLGLESFGFRRIVADFNIHQLEQIPTLKITTALNSLIFPSDRPEYRTLLLDEVVLQVPGPMRWLEGRIIRSLRRHTAIQCEQDETFRQRREQLGERGIRLPFSLFNQALYDELTSRFQVSLQTGAPTS